MLTNFELGNFIGELENNNFINQEQKQQLLKFSDNPKKIYEAEEKQTIADLIQVIKEGPLDKELVKSINAAGSAVAKKDKEAREAPAETTRNLVTIKLEIITYLENLIASS